MNFTFPKDIAKAEFLLYDLLSGDFVQKLQELLGYSILDEDISQIIETIERIQIRKQRELRELCKQTMVGRPMHI